MRALSSLVTASLVTASVTLALLLAACGDDTPARNRCPQCGMFTDLSERWNAGVTGADGAPLVFDSPKCLLRWLHGSEGRGASLEWVTEYYSQSRRPASDVWFVVGSDVQSPMGADLVPVAGHAAAERFSEEHHGETVVQLADVTDAMLAGLQ